METLNRAANRGSITTGGYEIDNSLKFEADNSEYMHYTCSGQTDYERMAYSVWLKRTELSTSQVFMEFGHGTANTSNLRIGFDSSDRLFCYGNSIVWRQTDQRFRDTSAWYHLFFLFDTTTPGGLSNNRIRIWVNGEMIDHGDFGVINNPSAGSAMGFNNSLNHSIGRQTEDATFYFCGYMAQVYASGGTPPVVGDFGEYDEDSGIWKPIDISEITPPDANGFNLDFTTASDLGNDISSRNNNFTEVNITALDQAQDSPTNNFCTLGLPVRAGTLDQIGPAKDGATYMNVNGTNQFLAFFGTIGVTSGKWYWEIYIPSRSVSYGLLSYLGLHSLKTIPSGTAATSGTSQCNWNMHYGDYTATTNNSNTSQNNVSGLSWYDAAAIGSTFAIAFNADDGEITYYKDGTRIGNDGIDIFDLHDDMAAGTFVVPFFQVYDNNLNVNFGGYTGVTISTPQSDENGYGVFEHTPPTGYLSLCTQNLATNGGA